jgi:hypothetical protein
VEWPYDMREVLRQPFPERIRLLARQWAAQVDPNPRSIMALYWAKYFLLFIGMWVFICSFNAGYPGLASPADWAFTADAFRKAVAWAIFYELCGLGCSSGPMNARFWPPIGGILHFLRPGTTKLPLVPGMPVLGGITRSWLDVALYAANQLLLLRLLVAPEVTPELMWPLCALIPLLGLADKTLFLAARAEHYWVALCCLTVAYENDLWVSACKVVWCFIWFWAATSKLNAHFPSVIMVMMNNGPFFPRWLKKHLFAGFPDDLRPSRFAGDALPARYRRRLARYRYGPGVFKIDWALDGPIPWRDPRCLEASTVHVGGTLAEICASERALYADRHHERPFLILCQQSDFDASRASAGRRTGYAYCHVPHGSTLDRTDAIEAQVERFAPGFRDRIVARHTMGPAEFHAHNPNYVGGAITGGVADAFQLFTRPVARLDPYSTPNPRLFLCSASTPPGGGVHGMCGYWAAQSALRRL